MMQADANAQKARVRATFDGVAHEYDSGGPGCFAYFGRQLVDVVGVAPGHAVLDVASGRGAVLFPAAERAGGAGRVVGVDLAEGMARATNSEAVRRGIGARVQVMDAEHLDFPDAAFDRVLCGFGIMFLPQQNQALAEFRRVLRPGGLMGVSTWRVSQAEDLATVLRELGLGEVSPPGWITDPTHLAELLESARFRDVHVREHTATFRYTDVEQYWQNARGTGLRPRLDTLDVEQAARARTALAERLQGRQQSNGIMVDATALLATGTR